jgi:hypothetical protein
MSIELVGFENLPNAFIKNIVITKASAILDSYEFTIRVHDLPDRSIWSSTGEIFYQLMRIGVVVSTSQEQTDSLTNGGVSPLSVEYMSKSLAIVPRIIEGNSSFELKFNTEVESDVSHVALFAFCFISKEDIINSFGIDIGDNYVGPVKSEKIIEAKSVVSSTNVFLRKDGSYWSGPVHEHNGMFMEGSYHTNTPHNRLTIQSIVNTKIKDKRDIIETKHSSAKFIDSFMSELFVSYSSETDVNSMFMINMKTLLMKNTKYGAFLNKTSQDVINTLINQMNFRMISIQRQRIKANFRGAGLRSTKRKADKIFHKKNILNTQDDSNRRVLKKIRLERNGSFDVLAGEIENTSDYKKIADIEELFFDYGAEIRTFQFTDYELTPKTPGDYQYKIQLQFVDPVDKFLRNTLDIMKNDISDLAMFLNIFKRRGAQTTVDAARIIKNYLDHYSYIYKLNNTNRLRLSLRYTSLINPATTDPASISKFLFKYRELYNDFLVFIDHDDQKKKDTLISIKSKDSMSSRIVVEKVFDEIITPSKNSLSFSYLPESSNKKTAVYTKSAFFEQAQAEVEEDFIKEPSFLSKQVDDLISANLSDVQATKTGFFGPKQFISGYKKSILSNTLESAGMLNKIIQRPLPSISLRSISGAKQETEEGQYIEAEEILGGGHEFVFYIEREEDFNKPSVMTKSQEKFVNAFSGYNNNRTLTTTLNSVLKLSPSEAQMLPNQLKAVINGQSDATKSNFVANGNDLLAHPSTKNYYELKNFSVKEVIYVDGFMKDTNGNLLLNKPVYKTLMLNEFEKLSKPTLCFLKDYSNEKFNISGAQQVQAINSVFVIADQSVNTPRDQVVSSALPIYNTQDVEYQFMRSNIVKQTNVPIDVSSTPNNTSTTSISISTTLPQTDRGASSSPRPSRTFGGY